MSAHTPGPWSVCVHQDETTIEAQPYTVAIQVGNCDAYLIAAAPDLLAALKAVDTDGRDAYPDCDDCNAGDVIIPSHVWDMIESAIAKAEGR